MRGTRDKFSYSNRALREWKKEVIQSNDSNLNAYSLFEVLEMYISLEVLEMYISLGVLTVTHKNAFLWVTYVFSFKLFLFSTIALNVLKH